MKIIDILLGEYEILMLGPNVLIDVVYTKSVEWQGHLNPE